MREIVLDELGSKDLILYAKEHCFPAKYGRQEDIEAINEWIPKHAQGRVIEWNFQYWFLNEEDRALYLLTWIDG